VTIAHVASTGILTAVTDATPYDVTWTGVGPGRLAVMFVVSRLVVAVNTVNLASMPDPWTSIGTAFNASGEDDTGTTNDAGLTRVTALYRRLSGAESGFFTFTLNGGGAAAQETAMAGMQVYSTTLGGWAVPIAVTGVDNAHAANRSSVCGAWGSALAANDWVAWGFSSDTDTALTITAPTITQTSATFGTVTQRNRVPNGQGADAAVYGFDAPVTAGNANAPTLAFTSATAQCGAAIAVRIREQLPASRTDRRRASRQPPARGGARASYV